MRLALPLLLLALPAAAAPPPGGVAVTPELCAALAEGAAYVPGLAADGSAVEPADLPPPGPAAAAGAGGNFPVTIDAKLASQFGAPGIKSLYGSIAVRDGRVYFNGAPLGADATGALATACAALPR